MREDWELPPEDWAFFANEKSDLIEELQHCWIPSDEVKPAWVHEYYRQLSKENKLSGGGFNLPENDFKAFLKKSWVLLTDSQKQRVVGLLPVARGIYGDTGLMIEPGHIQAGSEWAYTVFVNWNSTDRSLVKAFEEFIEKERKSPPKRKGSGKRSTYKDMLKYLAAYRLCKYLGPSKGFIEAEDALRNPEHIGSIFYKSSKTLSQAAKKAFREPPDIEAIY